MSSWIECAIAIAYVFSLWMPLPQYFVSDAVARMTERNPDLLASRPDWQKSLHDNRRFLWACYGIGALLIAALLGLQVGLVPAPVVKGGAAMGGAGILGLSAFLVPPVQVGWAILFGVTWRRRLPLAPQRRATLEVRQISAYIPTWLWALAISLMLLSLAASAAFAMLGGSASKTGWVFFVGQALLFLILLGAGFWSVRRPPGLFDRYFGPGYRRYGARSFIASGAALSTLNLLLLGWWLMGHPLDPFYLYDVLLLWLPGMALAGAIWHRVNARNQPQDNGGQEQAS